MKVWTILTNIPKPERSKQGNHQQPQHQIWLCQKANGKPAEKFYYLKLPVLEKRFNLPRLFFIMLLYMGYSLALKPHSTEIELKCEAVQTGETQNPAAHWLEEVTCQLEERRKYPWHWPRLSGEHQSLCSSFNLWKCPNSPKTTTKTYFPLINKHFNGVIAYGRCRILNKDKLKQRAGLEFCTA